MPITFTENVQKPFVASDAPERLTLPDPGAAMIVPPPQVPLKPFGEATCNPEGRVSVNPIPVSDWSAFGLLTVNVNTVVPLRGIAGALNP